MTPPKHTFDIRPERTSRASWQMVNFDDCKKGETSAKTGCTPQSGEGGKDESTTETESGMSRQNAKDLPVANEKVSGLSVRDEVPNTASISASLSDYEVLDGLRTVSLDSFELTAPQDLFYSADDLKRTRELAEEIKSSGEISPLIVVVDDDGPYVLEGGHRLGALHLVGVKELPALVVLDLEEAEKE